MGVDYGEIEKTLGEISGGQEAMGFGELVSELLGNGELLSAKGILGLLGELLHFDLSDYRSFFLQIIGIAIGAAVLKALTDSFRDKQVGETGFFVTYLLLMAVVLSGFALSYSVARGTVEAVAQFMKSLVPAYCLSVAFCTGSASSLVFYQGTLFIIGLVQIVILNILLPAVNIYLVLMLVNYFTNEETMGQLAELLRQLVLWGGKALLGLVIGIQTVQGMILPMSDKVKRSFLYQTAESLPGIGNLVGGVTETVLGTGMLLKNAIGVAGLILLVVLCAVPLGKLLCQFVVCKLSAGVLQPVSDKRIIKSLAAAGEAVRMLLYLTGVTVLLFGIAIAVVAVSTTV